MTTVPAYAAVSADWGLGGTWLLDTVGGSLEEQGRAGDPGVMLAVWAAVVVKMIAAVAGSGCARHRAGPLDESDQYAVRYGRRTTPSLTLPTSETIRSRRLPRGASACRG